MRTFLAAWNFLSEDIRSNSAYVLGREWNQIYRAVPCLIKTPKPPRFFNHEPSFPGQCPAFYLVRIFFNCRFYYPVFAVLFLDYGMSVEQFALLNVAWAVAIVFLEVPSGALGDVLGRKRMVLAATILMILEMLILALVPLGNPNLVFALLLLNRILSGAAEASASGADEALAYDSLKSQDRASEWPGVLSSLMRRQSIVFVLTMLTGAALYDANLVNSVLARLPGELSLAAEWCHRLPIVLTLLMAVAALVTALRMRELPGFQRAEHFAFSEAWITMQEAFRWILARPYVLYMLLFFIACDSMVRLHLTLGSQYLRLIQVPEAWFGFFSAAFAALGFFMPKLAERCVQRFRFESNAFFLALFLWLSLCGLALALPWFGIIFSLLTSCGMFFIGYFFSHYLNQAIDSKNRATLLSFKGLGLNLGYGAMGLAYAAWVRNLQAPNPDIAYADSIQVWPWYFLAVMLLLGLYGWIQRKTLFLRNPASESTPNS
ncbi:MAG: MFS transporter [Blastochloris sp.]|nr:MFS transporter [Blastochloris sp.]